MKRLLALFLIAVTAAFAQAAPDVSKTVAVGDPVTISFDSATGTAPFSFQWLKDGVAIPGATNSTLVSPVTPMAASGVYTLIVKNSAGQTTSNKATLTVTPAVTPPGSAIIKFN